MTTTMQRPSNDLFGPEGRFWLVIDAALAGALVTAMIILAMARSTGCAAL